MRKELKDVAIYAIEEDLPVETHEDRVTIGTETSHIRVAYDETTGYSIRWHGWSEGAILGHVLNIIQQTKSQK